MCVEIIFKMRFTSKQVGRQAAKSSKAVVADERKAKEAMQKGNFEGARIFAESVIMNKNLELSYMKLESQLQAVSAKLQAQEVRGQVASNMADVTLNLDTALGTMDVNQISETMEKFITQAEDLDLQAKVMDGAIGESTSSSTPQGDVDNLLQRIADEHKLDVRGRLNAQNAPIGTAPLHSVGAQNANVDADFEARFAALQGGGTSGPPSRF